MAVARLKVWNVGDILTAADLNAEYNNILNNGTDIAFPLTKAVSGGGFDMTSLGNLTLSSGKTVTAPHLIVSTDISTGTNISDLLFTDATYDIGKSGATRPRDLFTSRNATIGGALVVSGTGPHAFGGATSATTELLLTGAFAGQVVLQMNGTLTASGGASTYAIVIDSNLTLAPGSGGTAAGLLLSPTINKFSAGTHPDFAGIIAFPPAIGAGAATLTNASTLKITGAPTVGTNKYSLWCISTVAGDIRLDSTTANGTVATAMSNLGPVGSHTTIQEWLTININGTLRYIPCF